MSKGYRTYRGRTRGRTFFPILVVFLIIFALIVLLLLALQDSIIFSSEGLRFLNPFDDGNTPLSTHSPSPSKEPELVIVSPETSPSPTPDPTPEPVADITLRAVFLPSLSDPVATAGVIQLADKGVINAVVIDMKHDDGTLGFTSQNPHAVAAGANPAQDNARASLDDLKAAGLHLIARMSAFKDDLIPRKVQSTSVKVKSGVIWLDRNYHGWLNPYLPEAQDYVSDIASELADLGFQEILLENYSFPTLGRPQLLFYGEYEQTSKTDTLTAFAESLSAKLADKGVALSINVNTSSILNGPDTATGQDPAALLPLVTRLFTGTGDSPEASGQIYNRITDIAGADKAQELPHRFVSVIAAPRAYDDPSASENIQVALGAFVHNNHGWLILDPAGLYPSAGW